MPSACQTATCSQGRPRVFPWTEEKTKPVVSNKHRNSDALSVGVGQPRDGTYKSWETRMTKPQSGDPFSQFAAMFQQYQLPGLDVSAILEARRKDVEALTEANQAAFGGMQAIQDKQLEILRRALDDFQSIAQQLASSPTKPPVNPADAVQKALHAALADMQDIAQKTQRTQTEAYAIVSKRIEDAVQELKTSLERPQK
jgi:phasin family protein